MKASIIAAFVVGVILLGGVLLFVLTVEDENESASLDQTLQTDVAETNQQLDGDQTQPQAVASEFTIQEVSQHNSSDDCWTIIEGSVYDITSYVSRHPGGNAIELACGTDGTSLFTERTTADGEEIGSGTSHSSNAERQLSSFFIGTLAN